MVHPSFGAMLDSLQSAQECARQMKVHRRQCELLCSFVENALTRAAQAERGPESSQQWDDALSVLQSKLTEWSRMDYIQSYLQSDRIRVGIDELYGELKWTAKNLEGSPLQLSEMRRQDEDLLQNILVTICTNNSYFNKVFQQSSDSIRLFVKRLQSVIRADLFHDKEQLNLELALKSLYKNANVHLRTPDLTTMIRNIDLAPMDKNAMTSSYKAVWIDEIVVMKALRRPRDKNSSSKILGKEFEQYFNVRHPDIIRVYGMFANDSLGYCVVSPAIRGVDILSHIQRSGDSDILTWAKDIAGALSYLHNLEPPIAMGCIRADNICVKGNKKGVVIREFGLLQLCGQPVKAVQENLPWCSPEVIRASRIMQQSLETHLVCTTESDMYSYAMFLFEVFTGQVPFHHISDASMVEPEILHGTRPIMSKEHKSRATVRGWSTDVQKVMRACWDGDPKKRPAVQTISEILSAIIDSRAGTVDRPVSSASDSSENLSLVSFGSGGSRSNSLQYPQTPETKASSIFGSPSLASSSSFNQAHASWLSTSPHLNDLIGVAIEDPSTIDMGRKMSAISFQSDKMNVSEKTIRANPRSSFSDDSDDESHLGKENTAYERMPKLRNPSLSSTKKRINKERFDILVGRMTVDGKIDPKWAGVASMEGLRSITRGPRRLTQVTAVENILNREVQFCGDKTADYLAQRLRQDPSILGEARTEEFLSHILEDSHNLRLVNEHFKNALQACSDVVALGFTRMALLCKEAASQISISYPEYIHNLPVIGRMIQDEMQSNTRFAHMMQEQMDDSLTLHQALLRFLRSPATHLDSHPRALQLILNEMTTGDQEADALLEARQEMNKAVYLVHLASWQQSERKGSWKDYVLPEAMREVKRDVTNRQIAIFSLINEERDYVRRLEVLRGVLLVIQDEVANLRRRDDTTMQDSMRSLVAILGDLLRFHRQLSDNFFTLQRSQHPFIGPIVSTCGIDQIPWHSLYDFRFASSYQKLAKIMEGSKVRAGIFRRVMQDMVPDEADFMTFLRLPSLHLSNLVKLLMEVSESTSSENEDRQLLDEQLSRLWTTCRQVEMKTSLNKERARLASLASALDFSKFPGAIDDIHLASESRILVMSGPVKMVSSDLQTGQIFVEESFIVLLDNYLLFADKIDNQGINRFVVSRRPLPLDIAHFDFGNIPLFSTESVVPCVTVVRLAGLGRPLHLYTYTETLNTIWQDKFKEAFAMRATARETTKIVDLELLHKFMKMPSCSSEFNHNGLSNLVVACNNPTSGIWLRKSDESSLQHVIDQPSVSGLTVVKELGIALLLTENNLYAYRLEEIVKGGKQSRRCLDETMTINFYRIGMLRGAFFLVLSGVRKGKLVLRFYEAHQNSKSPKVLSFKNKFGPFSFYAEAEMMHEVKDVQFLTSSLVLVTDNFQLVTFNNSTELRDNLTSAKRQSVPFDDDPQVELVDRCRASEPLAVHRTKDDFVLCYKEFAAYINLNGRLAAMTVEWEVENVQRIIFRHPYMFVFGSRAIEVREIVTRELKQLIPVPGQLEVSYEAVGSPEYYTNFGIHIIMKSNSLSGDLIPFNLLRIRRI